MPRLRSVLALAAPAFALLAACRTPAPASAPAPAAPRPASATPATSTQPTTSAAPAMPSLAAIAAGLGGGEPGPRPYMMVVGPGTRTQSGLLTTHQTRGRLYFEIPARQLGRDMLVVTSLRGTPTAIGINGTLGGPNRLVRWERREHRVLLRAVSHRNVTSDSSASARAAVDIIRYEPILAVFNVEAYGPDSAAVVDVTRLFTGGVAELAAGGQRSSVDASRSFIEKVSTFERNVEIEASQTFAQLPTLPIAGAAPGATTELYHFSIVRLPDVPMAPRLADERVGYFTTQQLDFGAREQRVARRTFINRWRLECSDQKAGTLCYPVKPITYYVDPATPAWLVPWVRRGIEEWQVAFEAAGFKNAIVARETVPNDPAFAGENANVSMVRWLPSTTENAVGPSTVDPRSGEILDADVQLYQNVMNLQRAWYFTQVGHLDPRVRTLPMPDSLMGRLVQFAVAHEVGHTLGFPHNMKASAMYPVDSVRSRTWVARMGHTPSIMDYARFNYVAQPEDGIALGDLVPRVGPYDVFAVRWGYAPIGGATTPEQERPALDALARQQDTVPWLRFASDLGIFGADPGETNEAVGDADAVRSTALGLRNIRRIMKLVEPATTARPGESYADLDEMYGRLVAQWATELGHVARIPGGEAKQAKVVGQPGAVYVAIPAARQRAAIAFLNANAFATPTYLIDPSILRKIEPAGSIDRIAAAQRRVLATLFDNARLQRLVELEAMSLHGGGGGAYSLGEMLGDLRRGIWREIYTGAPIDPYRRRLQRGYLATLAAKINPPPPAALAALPNGLPRELLLSVVSAPDAVALLRGELMELDRELAGAVARTSDRTSRLHLQAARDDIAETLHPRR